MKEYKSESSINKLLAELQLASTATAEVATAEDRTFEIMLREALQSENEAIKIYEELAEKSDAIGSKILVKAFKEISNDEKKHVGNLTYLMKLLCEDSVNVEEEGEAEEAQLQAKVE